jgi:hypothetical protein
LGDTTEPTNSLVFLQPGVEGWWKALRSGAWTGKWLSEGIVCLDGSPFSHVLVKRGDDVIDARRRKTAVQVTPFWRLACLNRRMAFLVHDAGGPQAIGEVWDAISLAFPPMASAPGDPGAESNVFTVQGMLRIGILMIAAEKRWLRRLGIWALRLHRDDAGLFCSELVAKGFAETDHLLEVLVNPTRIPPGDTRERRLLADLLYRRAAYNTPGIGSTASAVDFDEQLDAILSNVTAIAATETEKVPVPVGYRDPDNPDIVRFPPSLVTPRDLFESPSLRFVTDDRGRSTAPVLDDRERACRCREWLRASVVSILAMAVGIRVALRWLRRR